LISCSEITLSELCIFSHIYIIPTVSFVVKWLDVCLIEANFAGN